MNATFAAFLYKKKEIFVKIFKKYNASWLNESSFCSDSALVFRVQERLIPNILKEFEAIGIQGTYEAVGMQVTVEISGFISV